jgi:hypothetical protein
MSTVLRITLRDDEIAALRSPSLPRLEGGLTRLRQMAEDKAGEGIEVYFRAQDETLTAVACVVGTEEP